MYTFRNRFFYTLNPTSCSPHPTPCTLRNRFLYTLHATPYTLHPTPYTLPPSKPVSLDLTSYALHPTPYTVHPIPYTLHPTPCTCFAPFFGGCSAGEPPFFGGCSAGEPNHPPPPPASDEWRAFTPSVGAWAAPPKRFQPPPPAGLAGVPGVAAFFCSPGFESAGPNGFHAACAGAGGLTSLASAAGEGDANHPPPWSLPAAGEGEAAGFFSPGFASAAAKGFHALPSSLFLAPALPCCFAPKMSSVSPPTAPPPAVGAGGAGLATALASPRRTLMVDG